MDSDGLSARFIRISEIVSRLAYLNLLWILFTVLGLGIFGIMPATVAVFSVTRKWMNGEVDTPVFKTFWETYRKEFFKSTFLGVIIFAIGGIIYIDLVHLPQGSFFTILRGGLIVAGLLYVIVLLNVFPIYVHYDWKLRIYLKNSLLIGLIYPHISLLKMIFIGILYYVFKTVPGLIPFFSVSLLSLVITWLSHQTIRKMEEIEEKSKELS